MTGKRTQLGPDEWSFVPSRAVSAAGNSCGSKEEAGSGSLSSERPLRARQGRAVREGGSTGYLLPGGGRPRPCRTSGEALRPAVSECVLLRNVCVCTDYRTAVPAANLCPALIARVHACRHGQFRRARRRSWDVNAAGAHAHAIYPEASRSQVWDLRLGPGPK